MFIDKRRFVERIVHFVGYLFFATISKCKLSAIQSLTYVRQTDEINFTNCIFSYRYHRVHFNSRIFFFVKFLFSFSFPRLLGSFVCRFTFQQNLEYFPHIAFSNEKNYHFQFHIWWRELHVCCVIKILILLQANVNGGMRTEQFTLNFLWDFSPFFQKNNF